MPRRVIRGKSARLGDERKSAEFRIRRRAIWQNQYDTFSVVLFEGLSARQLSRTNGNRSVADRQYGVYTRRAGKFLENSMLTYGNAANYTLVIGINTKLYTGAGV